MPLLLAVVVLSLAQSGCRLLSLSGGGSWGAFEAGVLQRILDERGDSHDYERILGVSAGSLNAALLATEVAGNAGLREGSQALRKLWSETRTYDVWKLKPLLLGKDKSLLSNTPLRNMLAKHLANRAILRNITVGVTSLTTGGLVLFDERDLARDLLSTLLASSAIPVLFPPEALNGTWAVDGGIAANVLTIHGIERCAAIMPGARIEIDIINAIPLIRQSTATSVDRWGVVELALRAAQIVLESAFDHQLSYRCRAGEQSDVHVRMYTPRQGLTFIVPTMLDFDHGAMLWEAGYAQSGEPEEFDLCV